MADVAAIMDLVEAGRMHAGRRGARAGVATEDLAGFVAKLSERLGLEEGAATPTLAPNAMPGKALALEAGSDESVDPGKQADLTASGQTDALAISPFVPLTSEIRLDAKSASDVEEEAMHTQSGAWAKSLLSNLEAAAQTRSRSAHGADDTANTAESERLAGQDLPGFASALDQEGQGGSSLGTEKLANMALHSLEANQAPNAQAEIQAGKAFEQVLRQAEARLHAAIDTPVRAPGFVDEFAGKVVWLSGRAEQVAELTLNPPDLGAVEVRLKVTGNETGAQFYSANPVVRETIEGAIPRLRELLADAGLRLADTQVGDQAPGREKAGEGFSEGAVSRSAMVGVTGDAGGGQAIHVARGLGVVDLYV